MEEYCLYKHTAPNGKVYFGITCQNPLYRWNNGNGYARSPHMRNAIAAYGWDNIQHEILFAGLSAESAEEKEKELIALYDSTNPKRGYNIDSGGKAGRPLTEETKQKISKSRRMAVANRLGHAHTLAARRKMSDAHKGKLLTDEHKQKISASLKGRKKPSSFSEAHFKAVAMIDMETGEIISVFQSIKDAAKATGTCETSIIRCCKGSRNKANGFRWSYASNIG